MAGPHEVLGMARHLGLSTTEFLALHTDNGGTTLLFGADGRCGFLTESGCKVHPRRPLVCRLYPLGRATDGAGDEKFAQFPKEAGCEAEFGTDGTIEGFLESQGVAPYIEWSVRYGELYKRMLGLLERLDVQGKVSVGEGPEAPAAGTAAPEQTGDRAPLSAWQDIDASLADYCAAKGLAVPAGIDDAIALHLEAMKEWLDGLESRLEGAAGGPEGGSEK